MSDKSSIEWTEATWNPVVGCTRASRGCDQCYAMTMTNRLEAMGQERYRGLTVLNAKGDRHFNGVVRTVPEALGVPLRWRRPRRIFVNSMSDLFHKDVPFEFIDRVFAVMALCPQHTFQVLTKRPERMAEWCERVADARVGGCVCWRHPDLEHLLGDEQLDRLNKFHPWPLPNVWLGTSVEDQAAADKRIPALLQCPAAVRFLSCEPLLGDLDLTPWLWGRSKLCADCPEDVDCECGEVPRIEIPSEPSIGWAIIGCESGPLRRFQDGYSDAAISLARQCILARVPIFHKQMPINGKVSHDPADWPEWARVREWPKGGAA